MWDDVELVYAFTYYGFHAEVLKRRDDWFVKGEWAAFVCWWIDDDESPARAQGAVWRTITDRLPTPLISKTRSTQMATRCAWAGAKFRNAPKS